MAKRFAGQDGVADDVVVVGRKGFHGKRYGNVHPNRVAGLYVKRGTCNVGGDKKLGILACPGHVADLVKADVNAGRGKFCTFVLGGYHHVGMECAVKDGSAVEYLAVVNYYITKQTLNGELPVNNGAKKLSRLTEHTIRAKI